MHDVVLDPTHTRPAQRRVRQALLVVVALAVPAGAAAQASYLTPDDSAYLAFYVRNAAPLLPTFRLPLASDMRGAWARYGSRGYTTRDDQDHTKAPYWTKGVFNADGVVDYAFVVIDRRDGSKWLYAVVSEGDGWRALALDGPFTVEMGVATQQPGLYMTTSGADDAPDLLRLERQGIAFFDFDDELGSVFVWDDGLGEFVRHWPVE